MLEAKGLNRDKLARRLPVSTIQVHCNINLSECDRVATNIRNSHYRTNGEVQTSPWPPSVPRGNYHTISQSINIFNVLGGQLGPNRQEVQSYRQDLLPTCKAFPKETTTCIWFTQSHKVCNSTTVLQEVQHTHFAATGNGHVHDIDHERLFQQG